MSTDSIGIANAALPRANHDRRSIADMLGEVLREAGVLFAVFIPLDLVVQGHPLTVWAGLAIVVLPAVLLASGMMIERTRRK